MIENLPTPSILIDRDKVQLNILKMQSACNVHAVSLWPHIKTHKMLEVARMQLEAGAAGLCCAKLGEAEVMVESGVKSIFIAHSLVDPLQAPRLRALAERLDNLILAVTSEAQAEALEAVLSAADLKLQIMVGCDTGLGREGARGVDGALWLAKKVQSLAHMELKGIYTHEGHSYASPSGNYLDTAKTVYRQMMEIRSYLDPSIEVWPGCSVTAAWMAQQPGVTGVRPGTYVFGDLSLTVTNRIMHWDDLAATIYANVVDRPDPGLALLDAGSKTFTSDKTPLGLSGALLDGRDIHVTRLSEEHGWTTGPAVDQLKIGERVRVVPAHICPVINLTDEVVVISQDEVVDRWKVAARGKVQ